MAAKTAKNGVITMVGGDTVAKGGQNYKIESIVINEAGQTSTSCTLYSTEDATAGTESLSFTTSSGGASSLMFYIGGCLSTGGGLSFDDNSAAAVIAYIYVR